MKLPTNPSEQAERYKSLGSFLRDESWYLTLDRQKVEAVEDLLVKDADDKHIGESVTVTETREQLFGLAAAF